MRRRVCGVSLILDCFDLAAECVLVLTCTAKLIAARGKPVLKASKRRRRLCALNIWLIRSPERTTLIRTTLIRMHEPCHWPVTQAVQLDCADNTRLTQCWQRKCSSASKYWFRFNPF